MKRADLELQLVGCRAALRRAKGYAQRARTEHTRRDWVAIVRRIGSRIFDLRCWLRRLDEDAAA